MKPIIIFPKEICEFTAQYAICYLLILPLAEERKIRLLEIAARGSPYFYQSTSHRILQIATIYFLNNACLRLGWALFGYKLKL